MCKNAIWKLDSGGGGSHHVLFGTRSGCRRKVLGDLRHHHGWESSELPEGWKLKEINPEDATAEIILALQTEELRQEALSDPRFPLSQQWGDGRAYPLECGEWVVDTDCGYAEEGWCEGYWCDECEGVYTDQYPCLCGIATSL
jgi:hypothetical protein